MGMSDEHFRIGDLKPMLPNSTELKAMLDELEGEIIDFEEKLTGKKDGGLTNVLDELLENVNKFKYRSTQK